MHVLLKNKRNYFAKADAGEMSCNPLIAPHVAAYKQIMSTLYLFLFNVTPRQWYEPVGFRGILRFN